MSFTNTNGYLDSAATTLKPKVVIRRVAKFMQHEYATVHRGLYPRAISATLAYENARQTIATFLNAKSSEIIFTKGTTESLNALSVMLCKKLQQNSNAKQTNKQTKSHTRKQTTNSRKPIVLLSELEHHANIVPWQQSGYEIKVIPIKSDLTLDMGKAKQLLTQVDVLSITHVSNVTGTLVDIQTLIAQAKKYNVITIIDAAQSVSSQNIDVKKLDCDFLVFSGHKLYGPTGIGILYGKSDLLAQLEPYQFGGNMIESVSFAKSTWASAPRKFEAGTTPFVEAIGLATAITFVESQKNKKTIDVNFQNLWDYAKSELDNISQVTLYVPKTQNSSHTIISFTVTGAHPHDIVDMLGERGVCVRGSHHCAMPLHEKLGISATIRISFGMYTKKSDIQKFIKELKFILTKYYKMTL
jgi:cysteine desulfurase / selenocysteine lyase